MDNDAYITDGADTHFEGIGTTSANTSSSGDNWILKPNQRQSQVVSPVGRNTKDFLVHEGPKMNSTTHKDGGSTDLHPEFGFGDHSEKQNPVFEPVLEARIPKSAASWENSQTNGSTKGSKTVVSDFRCKHFYSSPMVSFRSMTSQRSTPRINYGNPKQTDQDKLSSLGNSRSFNRRQNGNGGCVCLLEEPGGVEDALQDEAEESAAEEIVSVCASQNEQIQSAISSNESHISPSVNENTDVHIPTNGRNNAHQFSQNPLVYPKHDPHQNHCKGPAHVGTIDNATLLNAGDKAIRSNGQCNGHSAHAPINNGRPQAVNSDQGWKASRSFIEVADDTWNGVTPKMSSGQGREDKQEKKRQNRGRSVSEWSQVLYEFAENTTLHGVRHIAKHQPYALRRLFWLLLVLTGLSIFLYQMVNAIILYASHPVSVNVKVNYNDTIIVPSLTICNQNAFRKTQAVENSWYGVLSELYSDAGLARNHTSYDDVFTSREANDVTMYELFDTVGHSVDDMIVRCVWDGKQCGPENFTVSLTDYGKCYTFGSAEEPRFATRTGTEGGLQLLLNVEQYEYMPGPNQGAGLRVLLHNHRDVPLVRDFGIAVPPGSNALLGASLVRIHNLPQPHGQCDDTKADNYTKLNCLEDCKLRYIYKKCGCYQLEKLEQFDNNNDTTSSCTVEEQFTCVLPTIDGFNHEGRLECDCQIPCILDTLEFLNSYGDISQFDAKNLLSSDLTSALQPKFIHAQEVTQKVNEQIVQQDRKLVSSLDETLRKAQKSFQDILEALDSMEHHIENLFNEMDVRLHFHEVKGLGKVLYIVEHDFVRGWTILEERTLPYLCDNFFELRESFGVHLDDLAQARNGTDEEKVVALTLWKAYEKDLKSRLFIAQRIYDNVSEVHESYKTGKPLLTYQASRNRRYDMTWITVELLQAIVDDENHNQDFFYDKVFEKLDHFVKYTNNYIEMGNNFTNFYEIDEELQTETNSKFRSSCTGYNFYIFLYKSRIVDGPIIVLSERIEKFELLKRILLNAKNDLLLTVNNLKIDIQESNEAVWRVIERILHESKRYINQDRAAKMELSREIISETTQDTIANLEFFFSNFRKQAQILDGNLRDLEQSMESIWENMLTEYTTFRFYEKVHEDFLDHVTNNTGFYLPYFADLLDVPTSSIENTTNGELEMRMNADFPTTNLSEKLQSVQREFDQLRILTNTRRLLGSNDEELIRAIHSYKSSMESFIQSTEIDVSFYQTNFIQMNFYMQTLSYEEILQQPAYDMLNLIGDIGGSFGLFLGASLLTVVEIADLFLMQCVRMGTIK